MKWISKKLLQLFGWKMHWGVTPEDKCIIIGAPHTSSWDFVISWLFYKALGREANVLIKKDFFFWPLGNILTKMGGIPVDRSKGANIIRQSIRLFEELDYFHLAISPEGTRKRNQKWKAGFHTIASGANVPVYVASYDWGRKQVSMFEEFKITEDAKADIKRMKDFYSDKGVRGKHPGNFTAEY
jgi:1-acyl-sn-glycerol-3-phosphate acyltransferase